MKFRIDFNKSGEENEILKKIGAKVDEETGWYFIDVHFVDELEALQNRIHEAAGHRYYSLIIDFEPGDNTIFIDKDI